MSDLYKWFKSRNEETAINKTLIHMKKVLECVVEYEKGLTFFIKEREINLALKVFFRVDELEHQADNIRRNILNMLSIAELPSTIRENLMHLVKRIDDVANAANASARILISLNHKDFLSLGEDILNLVLEMGDYTIEAVKNLDKMVNKLLTTEDAEIEKLAELVNNLEHKVDEKRYAINRYLVSDNPKINPFSAITIHNSINALEAISDNAEEVADYIIMLKLTKRT